MDLFVEAPSHTDAVQLISYHELDPEKDEIPWLDLTDNRDFKVMATWEPIDRFVHIIWFKVLYQRDSRCKNPGPGPGYVRKQKSRGMKTSQQWGFF